MTLPISEDTSVVVSCSDTTLSSESAEAVVPLLSCSVVTTEHALNEKTSAKLNAVPHSLFIFFFIRISLLCLSGSFTYGNK